MSSRRHRQSQSFSIYFPPKTNIAPVRWTINELGHLGGLASTDRFGYILLRRAPMTECRKFCDKITFILHTERQSSEPEPASSTNNNYTHQPLFCTSSPQAPVRDGATFTPMHHRVGPSSRPKSAGLVFCSQPITRSARVSSFLLSVPCYATSS